MDEFGRSANSAVRIMRRMTPEQLAALKTQVDGVTGLMELKAEGAFGVVVFEAFSEAEEKYKAYVTGDLAAVKAAQKSGAFTSGEPLSTASKRRQKKGKSDGQGSEG